MNKMTLKGKTIMEAIRFLQEEYPGTEIVKNIQSTGEIVLSVEGENYLYDEFYVNTSRYTGKINYVDRIKVHDRFNRNYYIITEKLQRSGLFFYTSSQINGYTSPGDVRVEQYKGRYGEGVKIIFHFTSRNSICEYWT